MFGDDDVPTTEPTLPDGEDLFDGAGTVPAAPTRLTTSGIALGGLRSLLLDCALREDWRNKKENKASTAWTRSLARSTAPQRGSSPPVGDSWTGQEGGVRGALAVSQLTAGALGGGRKGLAAGGLQAAKKVATAKENARKRISAPGAKVKRVMAMWGTEGEGGIGGIGGVDEDELERRMQMERGEDAALKEVVRVLEMEAARGRRRADPTQGGAKAGVEACLKARNT
jgi:hypothetical protein